MTDAKVSSGTRLQYTSSMQSHTLFHSDSPVELKRWHQLLQSINRLKWIRPSRLTVPLWDVEDSQGECVSACANPAAGQGVERRKRGTPDENQLIHTKQSGQASGRW